MFVNESCDIDSSQGIAMHHVIYAEKDSAPAKGH